MGSTLHMEFWMGCPYEEGKRRKGNGGGEIHLEVKGVTREKHGFWAGD